MTNEELGQACERLSRATTNSLVLDVCRGTLALLASVSVRQPSAPASNHRQSNKSNVLSGLSNKSNQTKRTAFDKRSYQRVYMQARRARLKTAAGSTPAVPSVGRPPEATS